MSDENMNMEQMEKMMAQAMKMREAKLAKPKKPSRIKGCLDVILEKVISRKLLVFATATILMAYALIDPDTWGMIAMLYIGGQSVIDAVKTYKFGG